MIGAMEKNSPGPLEFFWAVLAVPLPGTFLVPLFLCLRARRLRSA